MNMKKEVVVAVRTRLQKVQNELNSKLMHNKWEMNKLAKESAMLKRERAALTEVMRMLPKETAKV